ncbi:MAG: FtsQ-type POTRA domain-containing protein [Ruminococcus sp.]|nr:FtsQ-type POTRA domain-containing protein [Ruminococcus sp.]
MKDVVKSQVNDEYKVINGRRVKVRRRRRRSNLAAYCAIAIAVFTAIGLVVSLCFLFDLKKVRINGLSLYTSEQILAVGGIESGANLVRINTSVIEKRLVETLPYIEKATVSKDYPNTLDLELEEAVKSADIELNNRYYVLSVSGRLLECDNLTHYPDLPLVKGLELKNAEVNKELESEDPGKVKIILSLLDEIRKAEFEGITVVDITDRTNIILYYQDRIDIKLGSSIDMAYKLKCVKAVITEELPEDYEGTLKYNGAVSGVSAIAKAAQETTTTTAAPVVPEGSDTQTSDEYTGWQ